MSNPAEHYAAHVDALKDTYRLAASRAGGDTVVINAGAAHMYFRDDQAAPFRANPYFCHWLPIEHAEHCCIVLGKAARPTLLYYQPRDYWHLPPADPNGHWVAEFAVEVIHDLATLGEKVAKLAGNRAVYLGESQQEGNEHSYANTNPPAATHYIDFRRAAKSSYEQACLREATRIAVLGHIAARDAFFAGAAEFDIHNAYLSASRQHDAALPYANIVAINEHAGVLHYQLRDRTPARPQRSFLLDAGARFQHYCADITRTYARESGTFAQLVQALDTSQQRICAAIAPGMPFLQLHELSHRLVATVLADCGVFTCTAEQAFESGLTRSFLPHGLGHLLGIQTHDVGGHLADDRGATLPPPAIYPALRNTRTIAVDQVFTIEPGVYFIPMLVAELRNSALSKHINWQLLEELMPYGGVRIEDNVIVRSNGVENMTRDAFAAADKSG